MEQRESEHFNDESLVKLWSIFKGLIYTALVGALLLLGYLFLQNDIHKYLNRKVFTEKELLQIKKDSEARRRAIKAEKDWDKVVDGIHLRTGLHDDEDLQLIISTCTSCHSSKLITQNKATREGWRSMIKWMQETQGLGQLGKSEPAILDYLAKYYAPVESGRRKNLDVANIEWYILEQDE